MMMCCHGSTSIVCTQSSGSTDISRRTCISVILCSGLIGNAGSSPRYSTNTTRPPGFTARQIASALVGGLLLGVSARMIPGCNIWHLWGGLPILALQSLLFLAGLIPGAWLGSQMLARFVIMAR